MFYVHLMEIVAQSLFSEGSKNAMQEEQCWTFSKDGVITKQSAGSSQPIPQRVCLQLLTSNETSDCE